MSILEDIQKISSSHVSAGILGFVAIVSPGVLILYLFKPIMIVQFDVLKLLLLSSAFTMPLVTFNIFALAVINSSGKAQKWNDSINILGALLLTSIIFYVALLGGYLRSNHSFKMFILKIIILEVGAIIFTWLDRRHTRQLEAGPG